MTTRWQLGINSPFALQLAADARLSQTDYVDDQVWELALGSPGNPALALQTSYGGRGALVSLLPICRVENGKSGSPNTLSVDLTIPANDQIVMEWVHAALPNQAESLALAQTWLKKPWSAAQRRITQAAQAIPVIETGDEAVDAAIAFSY